MIEINKIYNEDCFDTMKKMDEHSVDTIITSPPYNTGVRKTYSSNKKVNNKRLYKNERRYDLYDDKKSNEEYIDWTNSLFNAYDSILSKDGCILYNISYGNENVNLLWLVLSSIISNTDFCIVDCITWKKSTAVPNCSTKNKLTRLCEFVFVIVRKNESLTFNTNKKVVAVSKTNQNFYETFYNYIEAKNNDGSCDLNKATFSSDLVIKLIRMYVKKGSLVYDSFMGTGTTAIGCRHEGINYIGSELSKEQCNYSQRRLITAKDSIHTIKNKGLLDR